MAKAKTEAESNGTVVAAEATEKKATARSTAKKQTGPLVLERIAYEVVEIPIVGETELIVHKWSEKAKRMMLDKQMNPGARQKKEAKNPEEDYQSSLYQLEDGSYGIPAAAFKAAIVGACRLFDGLPMTQAKIAIQVLGEGSQQLVPLTEGEPYMREDMVRLETGVADIRYRGGFPTWKAVLRIKFNSSLLTLQSLVNLVDAAGQGGVGEWRPSAPKSASGSYGTFRVETSEIALDES